MNATFSVKFDAKPEEEMETECDQLYPAQLGLFRFH
jgi:hypothetical protein